MFEKYKIVFLSWSYRADTDQLIGVVHHGNQEIEKDDDVDNREASKHDQSPEPGELLDSCQLEVVQIYQAKSGPEQCLRCLPQTIHDKTVTSRYRILSFPYLANFL